MTTISLTHDSSSFNALYFNAEGASRAILFAVGSGGNPERHLPLLQHLHERGMTVIAPYFERLVTSGPDAGMLLDRAARLRAAFRHVHKLQVAGIGHSIGATLLLAMAGGNMFTAPGAPLPVVPDTPMDKLVLFTPPTGYFDAPGALDKVLCPVQVWAGELDAVTPPVQLAVLQRRLPGRLDARLVEHAGHFTFMNVLPPGMSDSMEDREKFLQHLAKEVETFVST